MNQLRRLTRWWRAHRPVIVAQARYRQVTTRLFDCELRHYEDQQRIQQLTTEKENLQAQLATLRSLLAVNERELSRQRLVYDEAVDEINRLSTEVRRLRRHERMLDRGILAQLLERHISEN